MPKLSSDDPILKSLPEMVAYLPNVNEMAESSAGLPSAGLLIQESWAFQSDIQWQRGVQVTGAAIATNIGIPVTKIFRDVVEIIGLDVRDLVEEAVDKALVALTRLGEKAKEILLDTLEAGVGIAVNAMSAIPIVGMVIDLLWDIGMLIKNLIDIVRAQREEQESIYLPTRFEPEIDATYYKQRLLNIVKNTKDWTSIFSPPGIGRGAAWQPLFFISTLKGGGKRIMTSGALDVNWLGCVPGSGYLHQSLEVGAAGGTRDAGSFLPTARDQGAWLWKHIQKGELPSMYTIDAAKCRARWESYLMDLWVTLWETNDLSDSMKADAWDLIAPRAGSKQGALMRLAKPRARDTRLKWQKPDEKFLKLTVPIYELDVLEKRQRGYLDTITVAYLDESYAAIAGSSILKTKLKLRKKQLLRHGARCGVSLDDVIDKPYELALRESGVGSVRCGTVKFKAGRGGDPIKKHPKVPMPLPGLPGSGSESIPAPSRRRPSGIVPLAAAAAAAGGLWYLSKRRRRA